MSERYPCTALHLPPDSKRGGRWNIGTGLGAFGTGWVFQNKGSVLLYRKGSAIKLPRSEKGRGKDGPLSLSLSLALDRYISPSPSLARSLTVSLARALFTDRSIPLSLSIDRSLSRALSLALSRSRSISLSLAPRRV